MAPMKYLFIVPALFLAACIDVDETYTLNPDGSGKVSFTLVYKPMNPFEKEKDPARQLKKAVQEEMDKAQGVDAWKDISYERLEDGRFKIQATAYFKDLTQLKLHKGGAKMPPLTATIDQGVLKIQIQPQEREEAAKPEPLSDEEVAKRVKEAKSTSRPSR